MQRKLQSISCLLPKAGCDAITYTNVDVHNSVVNHNGYLGCMLAVILLELVVDFDWRSPLPTGQWSELHLLSPAAKTTFLKENLLASIGLVP